MNIIKPGKLPEDKEYKVTCSNCHTLFTFLRKEAQYITDQRDGDCLKVSCPLCNKEVYVNPNPQRYDWYEDH